MTREWPEWLIPSISQCLNNVVFRYRSGDGLAQWEEALHSKASSHWLSPYPEWSLGVVTNYDIRDKKSLIYTIKYAHGFVVVWLLQRYSISDKICTIMLCFVLLWYIIISRFMSCMNSPIARFMRPTWGSSGADRTQVGPMLAPWTLLSGLIFCRAAVH